MEEEQKLEVNRESEQVPSFRTSIREWKELATLSYGAVIPSQDSGNGISHLSFFLVVAYEHFTYPSLPLED